MRTNSTRALVIVLALLITATFYFTVNRPLAQRAATAQADAAQARIGAQEVTGELQAAQAGEVTRTQQLARAASNVDAMLPPVQDKDTYVAKLLTQIPALARDNGLEVLSFTVTADSPSASGIQVPFQAVVSGTYDQAVGFLAAVDAHPQLLTVSTLAASKQEDGAYSFTLTLHAPFTQAPALATGADTAPTQAPVTTP